MKLPRQVGPRPLPLLIAAWLRMIGKMILIAIFLGVAWKILFVL